VEKFFEMADYSHPLYRNAQVIMNATAQAAQSERQADSAATWGAILGSLTSATSAYQSTGGNLQALPGELSRQNLATSLDALTTPPAPQTQETASATLSVPEPLTAPAPVAANPEAIWIIHFHPEYIERVKAQCAENNTAVPPHVSTGFSDDTFASAAEARTWLHRTFAGGEFEELYRAGKVGMPELIP
jgi:hypothetical protein